MKNFCFSHADVKTPATCWQTYASKSVKQRCITNLE